MDAVDIRSVRFDRVALAARMRGLIEEAESAAPSSEEVLRGGGVRLVPLVPPKLFPGPG